jgi:hypothetical protein
MKHRFVVVLVVHTRDGVIVIVWIIRPPVERRGCRILHKCVLQLCSMATNFSDSICHTTLKHCITSASIILAASYCAT